VAHPQIAIFSRLAKENSDPTRVLAGQKTLLSRTMHDIRYDEIHDEMYVTNPFAHAVLVFRGGADGEEAPIRYIQGPKTQLGGASRLEVDPVHNEIFVPGGGEILVFDRLANGDAAPIRTIGGPDTQLRNIGGVVVDPVHDLLIAGTQFRGEDNPGGSLVILDRAASGNTKPKSVIEGPKSGLVRALQLAVYPPKGWIVVAQAGRGDELEPEGVFLGVWSIYDKGDAPPRWKIAGPGSTLKKPRGVAINPKHKEVYISDMRLNAVLTYYFPEIF
jgi:DNA-binding beta-propeller fold protein YncE